MCCGALLMVGVGAGAFEVVPMWDVVRIVASRPVGAAHGASHAPHLAADPVSLPSSGRTSCPICRLGLHQLSVAGERCLITLLILDICLDAVIRYARLLLHRCRGVSRPQSD